MLHSELHGLSMDLSWNVSTCCFAGREGERVGGREGGREGVCVVSLWIVDQ